MEDVSNVGLALGNASSSILGIIPDAVREDIDCSL
jgi:hypothetical protein